MSGAPSDLAKSDPVDATHARAPGSAGADLFAEFDREADQVRDRITPAKRGPGRPAGSPNRSTTMMARYLMAKGYRDPLEGLASIASQDPIDVLESLGLSLGNEGAPGLVLEIMKMQLRAREALLPYFHQALPKQVDVKTDGPRTLIVINEKSAQFQGVTVEASAEPHGQAPHDKGKSVEDQ